MVDINRDNNNAVAGKGILKRRIFVRNDRSPQQSTAAVAKPLQDGGCCLADTCKRCVTFDETITIKNDKDLVVKKPLKLELVIDNWKSNVAKTPPETIQPDPGIVRRLVDEFNTIEEPFTDSSEIESTSIEEDKVKEDKPMESRTNVPLCEALESVSLTTGDQ
ncbi:uncharacterized protein LOC132952260 isoform X2 [Metopolophium dirhodum]|uniref:uncharacterized protein LOC132952260 isoform X2 n=1 Tax=Metopolophium dirhodum TaxID=44670 RepID=UPI002990466C|nr:uncharacterized protein LOC132952260 isoform X2 [Metopolophium dirhodum]